MQARVLIIEDEVEISNLISVYLEKEGIDSVCVVSGEEGYELLCKEEFDLVILDLNLPGMDGFEFADAIRRQDKEIPILFMTALDDMTSKRKGFRIGIDDYMVKPIELDELLLRVEALLRRAGIASSKRLCVGNFVMDSEERTAYLDGEEVPMTVREFDILHKLLSYPDKIFTRQNLMDEIWGMDSDTDDRTINTHINRLRDKFEDNPDFKIVTIRGLGYKAVKNDET